MLRRLAVFAASVLALTAALSIGVPAQDQVVTIRAGALLDGKGGAAANATIVVRGHAIERVGKATTAATYDLTGLTVLPGMIDTHVHIAWHFGPDGRYAPRDASPTQAMGYALENAWLTLASGFTTVQSLGNQIDGEVRNTINRGVLPGPRILTSLNAITS